MFFISFSPGFNRVTTAYEFRKPFQRFTFLLHPLSYCEALLTSLDRALVTAMKSTRYREGTDLMGPRHVTARLTHPLYREVDQDQNSQANIAPYVWVAEL